MFSVVHPQVGVANIEYGVAKHLCIEYSTSKIQVNSSLLQVKFKSNEYFVL